MVYDEIVDETLARGRTGTIKDNIVELNRIEIACDASPGPRSQLSLPILFRFFGDGRLYARQKVLCEAFAKCSEYVFFGRKIEIESPFGDISTRSDLLDGGRCDAV